MRLLAVDPDIEHNTNAARDGAQIGMILVSFVARASDTMVAARPSTFETNSGALFAISVFKLSLWWLRLQHAFVLPMLPVLRHKGRMWPKRSLPTDNTNLEAYQDHRHNNDDANGIMMITICSHSRTRSCTRALPRIHGARCPGRIAEEAGAICMQ